MPNHIKSIIPLIGAFIALTGCNPKAKPGQTDDKGAATIPAKVEEAIAIPRDQVMFTSRPSPGSTDDDEHFDLFLKLGEKEVKIARGPNLFHDVKPGSSEGVPEKALSGSRLGYAGGAAWYFVAEEDGHYVVKVSLDDEGSFGGEGAVNADPAKAEVVAVFSKAGETIQAPQNPGN